MANESYLSNTKAPVELLGLAPLLNPFIDKLSSQRGMMLSQHAPQAQIIAGCEHPRIYTGFESIIGEYEYNTTERQQDIQCVGAIPKFIINSGVYPLKDNPYYTIIYRGDRDNKIGYFQLEKHTSRTDGYGYQNKWLNTAQLNKGNFIPKETKLSTSPAHDGNKYMLGVNLNTIYMSHPGCTEDAFIISESAARKLDSTAIGQTSFKILPDQIPVDLYGIDGEHKFMPDIGEFVNDEGILCALRKPTKDSIISDMSKENLTRVQYLHDSIFYVPPGAQILDVDIVINRKCKVKTQKELFSQVQKYKDQTNAYYIKIWEAYQDAIKSGREITPSFNTLVTRAISNLIADNVRIPGYSRKADVTLVKRKETIEFMYITVTYKYTNRTNKGFKLTGRHGNKGVVGVIWPDEDMPIDEHGIRADIIVDPVSVFNRMNPGQWYEQFINRGAQLITRNLQARFNKETIAEKDWDEAFQLILSYLNDVNIKYGELIESTHSSSIMRKDLVMETLRDGMYIQISPFQKDLDHTKILYLRDKYDIRKSRVTFSVTRNGEKQKITTKNPMAIGYTYWYSLYKMPKMRCCGVGYVNQYHSPVRASALAKVQYPCSQTAIRLGEDEIRNIIMVAGEVVAARIIGMYANSSTAVTKLAEHLMFAEVPSQLHEIPMTVEEIIDTNNINGVAQHIFSCFGVDITPNTKRMGKNNVFNNLEFPNL